MTDLLPIRGVPGSPYTRKMLALLRYRRIPYRFIQGMNQGMIQGANVGGDLPQPKVGLIPVLYLPNEQGELVAEVDSTPLIRRLEQEYAGREAVPTDPALAFIDSLLEDYGDEWLTKAMFHYRWYYDADIDLAGSILPYYQAGVCVADEQIAQMRSFISDRQISRLYVVGSNDTTAPVIEASYERFLACLNEHLTSHPFLMGNRPGTSDFACYGQLTQLVQFDPTPSALALSRFPRVHAWVSGMDDQSGCEVDDDAFVDVDALPATLKSLLAEVGRTYAPVMLANAAALDQGLSTVEVTVDGAKWEQEPFPYQGKSLQWLRVEYARLGDEDQKRVDAALAGTGCEALFAPAERAS